MYLDLLDRSAHPRAVGPPERSGEGMPSILRRLAAAERHDAPPGQDDSQSRPAGRVDRSTISVLVVDDNPAARYALSRGMRRLGFMTAEACTGAEAIELARFCSVVLLDVELPDVFGTEVCKLLRRDPGTAAMPIFHVSSAPPSSHKLKEADVACADGYFVTPADLEQLTEAIERLLSERGLA